SNTLKYTITLPEGAIVSENNDLTTYKTPEFLTQGENYQSGELYVVENVNMICEDEKVPVNSSTSTIKKSHLFDDKFDDTQNESPKSYQIRYQVLGTTLPTNDPNMSGYLVVYCKVPNPQNAWVEKQLYAIADGSKLFVTTIPKLDENGNPTTNTDSDYIVAAHFFKYNLKTPYTSVEFEGLPDTLTIITT
ncbi:MAG: hypothetical protein ACPGRC_11165, partial [Salibacteraceae bacterium]